MELGWLHLFIFLLSVLLLFLYANYLQTTTASVAYLQCFKKWTVCLMNMSIASVKLMQASDCYTDYWPQPCCRAGGEGWAGRWAAHGKSKGSEVQVTSSSASALRMSFSRVTGESSTFSPMEKPQSRGLLFLSHSRDEGTECHLLRCCCWAELFRDWEARTDVGTGEVKRSS